MRNWTVCIAVLISSCLTCRAQVKLQPGERFTPTVESVVMELPIYRQIRFKLHIADSLINALNTAADSLRAENSQLRSTLAQFKALEENYIASEKRNEQSFKDLNASFDKLLTQAEKPTPFFQRPWVVSTGTAIGLALITSLIK